MLGDAKHLSSEQGITHTEALYGSRQEYRSTISQVNINPVRASLVDPLLARIRAVRGVDVLLFNPPYVPTEELEYVPAEIFPSSKTDILSLQDCYRHNRGVTSAQHGLEAWMA